MRGLHKVVPQVLLQPPDPGADLLPPGELGVDDGDLPLRYLQRCTPVVGAAHVRDRPGPVALHDRGNGNRLSVLAMAGSFGAGDLARGVE